MGFLTEGLMVYPHEVSLGAGLIISLWFYLQYRKYNQAIERQQMVDSLLN